MAELKTIFQKKSFEYSGLISVQGLYRAAMNWLTENDFNPYEEKHMEQVFENGKEITIEIKGEKELSDYAQIKWKTKIVFTKLQEQVIQKDNQRVRMHKGKVKFATTVFLATDYDKTLEQTAFLFFLRTLIDRFVFKSYVNKAVARIHSQYFKFQETLKSYLNMESFR